MRCARLKEDSLTQQNKEGFGDIIPKQVRAAARLWSHPRNL
jgi:hypothetical protein